MPFPGGSDGLPRQRVGGRLHAWPVVIALRPEDNEEDWDVTFPP